MRDNTGNIKVCLHIRTASSRNYTESNFNCTDSVIIFTEISNYFTNSSRNYTIVSDVFTESSEYFTEYSNFFTDSRINYTEFSNCLQGHFEIYKANSLIKANYNERLYTRRES